MGKQARPYQGQLLQGKVILQNPCQGLQNLHAKQRPTAGKNRLKNTNHIANVGNKIHKHIQKIASATVADKQRTAKSLPTSVNHQGQRMPKSAALQPKSSFLSTQLHFSQNHLLTRKTTA
jgi:hypothetical protein